ncbi:uncharacterized protein LOC143276771 [Babylonia areolata]|uniref:uncharacterized protein LOC143276771 n=1 Tax=Babylonia areolata TaxID=304850 RepID=UPI003FD56BD1
MSYIQRQAYRQIQTCCIVCVRVTTAASDLCSIPTVSLPVSPPAVMITTYLLLLLAASLTPAGATDVCVTAVGGCLENAAYTDNATFPTFCDGQSERYQCLEGIKNDQCLNQMAETDKLYDLLKGFDYICSPSVRPDILGDLDCMLKNNATLNQRYTKCAFDNPATSCQSLAARRTCGAQAVTDCCPDSCQHTDTFNHYSMRTLARDLGCAWPLSSGSCSQVTAGNCKA